MFLKGLTAMYKMEVTSSSSPQYDLENILRLLTKKGNELSKKFPKMMNSVDKREESKMPDTGERKSSVSDVKPLKKIKLSGEKSQKLFSARAKCKRTQPAKLQEYGLPEKSSDAPKVLKDSPSRFWAFMDCYCSDINMEDVKVLEKWIESHENDSEYQTIPELGIHYTSKWIEEDVIEERKEGSKSMENPKGADDASNESTLKSELYQKIQEKITVDPEQPSFVEKLISSLVHENIISSPNDIMAEPVPEDHCQERERNDRILHLELNNNSIESRLRTQLIEQEILESNLEETVDDELLLELSRLQALLIPVSQYNLQKKKALLKRAKTEMTKQESQKRIQEADAKVMENYRVMAAARSKGKKMSKKELNQIKSILGERDMLVKNLKIMT